MDNKSSFLRNITNRELNILLDIELTKKDVQSLLVEHWYVKKELIDFLKNIKKWLINYDYDSSDIKYIIEKLWELTWYKVFLQNQNIYKNVLKIYIDNIESHTWLKSKWDIDNESNRKLKTDAFVSNEVTVKTYNLKLIQAYLTDFNKELDNIISSIDSLISLSNVKIKYLRDEKFNINN